MITSPELRPPEARPLAPDLEDAIGLLPLSWARGLAQDSPLRTAADWLAHGSSPLSLAALPWSSCRDTAANLPAVEPLVEPRSASALAQEVDRYRQTLLAPAAKDAEIAAVLDGLQRERRLRHRIDPRCWPGQRWRPALEPRKWLEAGREWSPEEADQLAALLHQLPEPEQPFFAGQLAEALPAWLAAEPQQAWRWNLVAAVIGGFNTRDPALLEQGRKLRQQAVSLALALEAPMDRATQLIRLLDVELCAESSAALTRLAEAIDSVGEQIEQASTRGDGARRRLLQRQLAEALRGAGGNLQLMQQVALNLNPVSCSQLPQRLQPSACLQLLKGVVLLDTATVDDLPEERQQALVMLFERLLPRVWWQADLLRVLLRDLRRFCLDLGWLSGPNAALLPGLLRLHRHQLPPPSPPGVDSEADSDPTLGLMRLQLLLLLRLGGALRDRIKLLRRVQELSPGGAARCWLGGDEAPLLEAACAGLGNHTVSLLRLWAQERGVPALLPLLPDQGGVAAAFDAVLDHWRRHFPPAAKARASASVAVVITTLKPDLKRLEQALESLCLQTLVPAEVVVVDDGSPEAVAEALAQLVERYRNEHHLPVRLIQQLANRGQYACRNLAIDATTAEVIAIQDDDDLSHPLRLERQWQALQGGGLASYAQHIRLDETSGKPQADGDGSRVVGDGITTLMVRRSTAVALGGFYPVRSRGDVEFRNRLQRRYGEAALHWLEQPLYLMRGAPTTISSGFEYGCSLRLPTWRRLIREGYLA
ncbi:MULTISPECIES: glycosyltransferase [Aphanothece]|uniref:glycosyltransferase n=1 Tax=Aphanothece TaxID=1121 RepID=UPI00398F23A4